MEKTTYIRRSLDIKELPLPKCHGGIGELLWTEVLGRETVTGKKLNFFHDNILKPGVSIGIHEHTHDEEYYYVIYGNGIMTLDDKEYEVGPGDITAVYPGGCHGLRNHEDQDLRIVVFSIS